MRFSLFALFTSVMVVNIASRADTEIMDDESERARVGQSSKSIGITFSPSVEMAFEQALSKAKAASAAVLTTEGVLLELLDEEEASEFLASEHVDVDALRVDLKEHLTSGIENIPASSEPQADEMLQNAMRRAVMKSLTSNKKGAGGADIIVAILVEADSFSANMLRKYGMTVESSENANLDQYLQRSKEQAKQLAELQEQARSQRMPTVGAISKNRLRIKPSLRSGTLQREDDSGHKTYVVRITSDDNEGGHIPFKAAISRNGILDLYVEETPFEIEFIANTVVGLFESVEGGDRLKVQLITELDGQQRSVSGFSGSAGAIFRDSHSLQNQNSGFLN